MKFGLFFNLPTMVTIIRPFLLHLLLGVWVSFPGLSSICERSSIYEFLSFGILLGLWSGRNQYYSRLAQTQTTKLGYETKIRDKATD